MNKTILQVPVSQQTKNAAEKAASLQGFSSLQEAVRVFLNKLAQGDVRIAFEDTVHLSRKAVNRYNKMLTDVEQGKDVAEADNVDELIKQLHNAS